MLTLTGELMAAHPSMTEKQYEELETLKEARRQFQRQIHRFDACLLLSNHARTEILRTANAPDRPINLCGPIRHLNDWAAIARRDAALTLSDLRLTLTWVTSAVGQSDYIKGLVDLKAWRGIVKSADAVIPVNDTIRNAHAHHAKHHRNSEEHAMNGTFISGNLGGVSYDTIDGQYFTFEFSESALHLLIALDRALNDCLQPLTECAQARIAEHIRTRASGVT